MQTLPESLERRLQSASKSGLERTLSLSQGLDFCSNDYLGFASDSVLTRLIQDAVAQVPVGSTGSRLLRGHSEAHEAAEATLAFFTRQATALLYPSGYQANVGVLSALLAASDRVYSDALNHASIIDGIRLSGCQRRIFRHGDMEHLESLLYEDRNFAGFKLIVTESLFSMEGDFAALETITELSEKYGASVLVDEAHATGVYGSGLVSHKSLSDRILASIHTGGKALGVAGAWVSGSRRLKDYLIGFSRSQIFSTSISPWIAQALATAVAYHAQVGCHRAKELEVKVQRFHHLLGLKREPTPIVPHVLRDPLRALEAARSLAKLGFDVRAIRPPTVPDGQSRLRITIKWGNRDQDLENLARAMIRVGAA